MIKRLPIPYAYCILIGIALGLIMGAKTYIYWGETDYYAWRKFFLPHFINNSLWGFLVPLVYYFLEKYPLKKGAAAREWMRAVLASLGVAVFHEITSNIVWFLPMHLTGITPFTNEELHYVIGAFPSALISRLVEFWIIYSIFAAIDYNRKFRDKALELAQMESQLSAAQLDALRLQLQPHFLFNTLNTISSLMEVSIKDARKIVSKLGQLLRTVLEKNKRNSVSLSEELEFIRSYLDIEQVRFHDRLSINYQIDPATLEVAVPSFLLQPLVENAIRHGFANQTGPARIEVSTQRVDPQNIEISIKDNGKGSDRPVAEILQSGIGIQNVKERLELLFGQHYQLEILTQPAAGFEIKIRIPDMKLEKPNPV